MPDPTLSNSAGNSINPSVPLDSKAQTSNPSGGDWQEEVYQQIRATKDLYLLNSRPIHGASGVVGDPTVESSDWRAQLQADLRPRIVNKHPPFSGYEGLQEVKKIAVRLEEKIYAAATSQSDYLRKLSLKMLTVKTRSQNPMSDPMLSNSTGNSINPSVDSTAQTGYPNGGDWQHEVYQKVLYIILHHNSLLS
ncbi:hypothetical protein L1987_55910 [Smallanthus sonchifolius]|uniref:Uncharacterized protein n=1 Tax=Smallanthus sonchifolius TaxID=185202 RepID=A0ACB9EBC3_9ASTR|nr:hypothetical protein L1987_55910 [Smallanthus sonchifolius]